MLAQVVGLPPPMCQSELQGPSFGFQPNPSIIGIWGVNQWMGAVPLSAYLSASQTHLFLVMKFKRIQKNSIFFLA